VLCGKARRSYGEQQQEQWGVALAGGVAAFMPIACVVAPYRRAPISLYPGVFFLLHSRVSSFTLSPLSFPSFLSASHPNERVNSL